MFSIGTAEVAERSLRKFFAAQSKGKYAYPACVALHGLTELALATNSSDLLEWNKELLKLFVTGEITHHMGAYYLYNIGGTSTVRLLADGKLPEAEKAVKECVEQLINECPRTEKGFLSYQTADRPVESIWIDMVFATCPFLAYSGKYFKNNVYFDEAVKQMQIMHEAFYDAECGLYHQAINIRDIKQSDDHWGRGNGWGIIAMTELVKAFPADYAPRKEIVDMLVKLLDSALKFQDDDGMWHQEMTDFDSYVETSGTGLILYALGVALELGLCPPEWKERFIKGLKGYLTYIGLDGSVHNCCPGCMCPEDGSKEAYKAKMWNLNDPHAFGPVGLAFAQAYKLGIKELKVEK